MFYQMTRTSKNVKTGQIPVTTSSAATCPPSCAFFEACYAKTGPLNFHWKKVTQGERGGTLDDLAVLIKELPKGQLWRHNQAGDLPGFGERLDVEGLGILVGANKGRKGFTYTHKKLDQPGELEAVREANSKGFTINLSGNNLAHADELLEKDAGPVVSVVPIDYARKENKEGWLETRQEYEKRLEELPELKTPKGNPVVVCPATRMDIDCATCGLCQVVNRRSVVAFPAHGTSKRKADIIAGL